MSRQRIHVFAVLVVLAPVTTYGQLISSFETDQEAKVLMASGGTTATRVKEHATHGQYAIKCLFPGSEKDTWPGLVFDPKERDMSGRHILGVDVYNPGDGPVTLSWRVDGVNGRNMFMGQSIPAKRKFTAQVFINDLVSNLGTKEVKRFYPYVRMPRRDVVLYFDNLRFMSLDLRFTPWAYEETAPAMAATDQERGRGYVLFARNWLDVVFANSRPRHGERRVELKAFATPGEYEPVTFSVHALRDLGQATVVVSALRCGQAEIPAKEIAVYPVRCLNKRVTYSSDSYVMDMPVLLERKREVDIAQGQSKRFWLDVHVPAGTPPGIYRGTATLQAANTPTAALPLVMRVLPFGLHEPGDMIWGEYYTGPKLANGQAQEREFLARDLRDMREHGATSVGVCLGVPTDKAKMTAQGVVLGFDGTSLWEHFMNLYRDLGFPAPVVQLSDSGQSFAAKLKLKFGSPEYALAYKGFWVAIQKLCKDKGWPEIIVQPVDEPGWQDRAAKDRNVALLKVLKQIPGMRTEQDGPGDDYFHKEAGPHADVWNYNGSIGTPEVVAAAQKQGRLVMVYNCDVESYRPEIGRYVPGFFQKRAGTGGCYNWSYMSWRGSPYDDLDHTTGTWMHVYPRYKGEVGGPSTGWQGFREGVDDYKYIATLERAVARARAAGKPNAVRAATAAEQTLQQVLDTIQYSPRVRGRARWTGSRSAKKDGRTYKIISGTLKLPNGWDLDAYDLARWQIADATLQVMAALGEVAPAPARPAAAARPAGALLSDIKWRRVASAPAARRGAVQQVNVPVVSQPPKIDGDVGEAEWKRAGKIDRFTLVRGGKPLQQTEAWLCADPTYLYVAFKCHEDKIAHLTANVAQDGGRVWEDDCVEVFIDGNADMRTCCQICINSLGKQYWADRDRPGWRVASRAAAKVGADAWFAEVAIPMRDIGLSGNAFGLNLCRERRPLEALELSCWSPTGDTFRRPERFGVARIGAQYIRHIQTAPPLLGRNALTATIENERGGPARLVAKLHWSQDGSASGFTESAPLDMAAKATRTVSMHYRIGRDSGPVDLRFELRDLKSGQLLTEHRMVQSVPSGLALRMPRASCHLGDTHVVVELDLAIAEELGKTAVLTLVLADSGTILREQRIGKLGGNRLTASLNVGGLPAGLYELAATLCPAGSRTPLAQSRVGLTKVRGPFD